MAESIKRSLVPAIFSSLVVIVGWLLLVSFQAGALENRVTSVETQLKSNTEKFDKILANTSDIRERLARVEAKLEDRK